MVKVAFDVEIASKKIEDAFDLWVDMRNDARWNPICERVALQSANASGVGASFRGTYKGFGDVVETVTEYDRPKRVARGGSAGPFAVRNDIRFSERDGKIVMHFSGEVQPRGLYVLMTPFMGLMMRRQAHKSMAAFKSALESGMTPSR